MDRRAFIQRGAGLAMAATAAPAVQAASSESDGPVLLTVSGAVTHPNRGPLDPASDVLMSKHGVQFDRARTYRYATLAAMAQHTIAPTLEYDGRAHTLRGSRLSTVLADAGAPAGAATQVTLRAFDGYTLESRVGEIERLGFILALTLDDTPMALGGLGPLWALYDADRIPEIAARPLPERFAGCPWGLYSIHVVPG